jgi:uncharacterized membrane-anchored protein
MGMTADVTVEGLSVAAISYYVVGLFGYLIKGAHDKVHRWMLRSPPRCLCR